MSDPPSSSSEPAQLPYELVIRILRYAFTDDPTQYLTHLGNGEHERRPCISARERLKPLRLEGHVFCDAVTPAVFASVHLHACRLSMIRAERIADSRLAIHVKEIVHHQGTFAGRNRDHKLFLSTLASHRQRQDYPNELRDADRDKFYQAFLEEVEAGEQFEKAGAFQHYPLQSLVTRLPNCRTFVSLPYHDEWHDPETSAYTLRRTGLSYLPMSRSTTFHSYHRFTSAIRIFRPQCLNLSLFLCEAIHALVGPMEGAQQASSYSASARLSCAKERFRKLEALKLGPVYGAKYGYVGDEQWSHDTTMLLQACENLVSLELTNDYPSNRRFAVLPKDSLPNLKSLTISKGVSIGEWTDRKILECATNVGSTLQHLHFNGIVLKSSSRSGYSSLILLLYELSQYTNLGSCTGLETVEDLKSKAVKRTPLRSGPKPGKKVLLEKLEQAVCHRRQWPSQLLSSEQYVYEQRVSELADVVASLAFLYGHWDETDDEFVSPFDGMSLVVPASNCGDWTRHNTNAAVCTL